jgi:hypothetical protein
MNVGFCVKCLLCLCGFQKILIETIYINFHENPSSGSRVVQCGQMDGRADKQTIASNSNFAKVPKNTQFLKRKCV